MLFAKATLLFGLVASAAASKCIISGNTDENCCWGGQNGRDACMRQVKNSDYCDGYLVNPYDYCYYLGISSAQCDADCCDPTTGYGKGCPK